MAERRMFTNKITESDIFLDMPLSTQALYFHLCMNADDDGFVKNPKRISKMIGVCDDDYKLLIAKNFVFTYESGVIVIKHWRMHNLLRKDRYKPTEYIDEKSMLYIKENGAYTLDDSKGKPLMATKWQPNDNLLATQDSIGKDSIGKVNISTEPTEVEKPDMTEWFDKFLAIYPKKNNYMSGQREFFKFFMDIPIEEWKPRAKEMYDALTLYLERYKKDKPDDKEFKFVPSIEKWFREDAMYWIREVGMNEL